MYGSRFEEHIRYLLCLFHTCGLWLWLAYETLVDLHKALMYRLKHMLSLLGTECWNADM